MLRTKLVAVVLVASVPLRAAADAGTEEEDPHVLAAIVETAALLGFVGSMYWADKEKSRDDFDLEWDWPSWKRKLSLEEVRFDTNRFPINAVHHPVMSVVQYHIGRSNNLGMFGSQLLATASALVWEFAVEYKEKPSINDLVINVTTGLEIGEPLWQIGQLWRGGVLTTKDRVRTALFSPLDAAHDAVLRRHYKWWRPKAWRTISVDAGVRYLREENTSRSQGVIGADIDLVADKRYMSAGPQSGRIKAGSWSRIRGRLDIGPGTPTLAGSRVETRTAFAGRYESDGEGRGDLLAIGTAFTYRRQTLGNGETDRYAISHLVGPQYQLSYRVPSFALRWDLDAYADFALIEAHAIGAVSPFPRPPPYTSTLQAQGYYPGLGVSGMTRFRIDYPQWSFDSELAVHQIWQIDSRDRAEAAAARTTMVPADPHGASDLRMTWRVQLMYRIEELGMGAALEGDMRSASWNHNERGDAGIAAMFLGRLDL